MHGYVCVINLSSFRLAPVTSVSKIRLVEILHTFNIILKSLPHTSYAGEAGIISLALAKLENC